MVLANRFEIGDIVIANNNVNFRYFVSAIRVFSHVRNEVEVSYDCHLIEKDGTLSVHIYYFADNELSSAPLMSKDTSIVELSLFNN